MNQSLVSNENNYNTEAPTLQADRFAHDRPSQNLFTTNVGHNDYTRADPGKTRGKNSNPVSGSDSGVDRDSDSRRDRER